MYKSTTVEDALDRAREQLIGYPPMPENTQAVDTYPSIDPMGKYSSIDMNFAYREARIVSAAQTRSPEVQANIHRMMNHVKNSEAGQNLKRHIDNGCQEHRLNSRAAKLANESVAQQLQARNKELENTYPMQVYETYLQALEYSTGLRKGPVPDNVRHTMHGALGIDMDDELVRKGAMPSQQVSSIAVNFQNFDNRMIQQQLANPRNWGKDPRDVMQDKANVISPEEVDKGVPSYMVHTATQALDPVFSKYEALNTGEMPSLTRGNLIIVDGQTVREKMYQDYMARKPVGEDVEMYSNGFDMHYRDHYKEESAKIVAAALIQGKRVEAFVPNEKGEIGDTPLQITKTGYEPNPLRPVTVNGFDRFCAKLGFKKSKEKVAQADEYQRTMAARERVKVIAQAASEEHQNNMDSLRGLFYADPTQPSKAPNPSGYSLSRGATASIGICAMLAQGYSPEDIMDPNKLKDERLAMGREVLARAGTNSSENQKWIAQNLMTGGKKIAEYLDEKSRQIDFCDTKRMRSPETKLIRSLAQVGFDALQEMAHCKNECIEFVSPINQAGERQVEAGQQNYSSLESRLLVTGNYLGTLSRGIAVGATMAGGACNISDVQVKLGDYLNGEFMAQRMAMRRAEKPGVPFSSLYENESSEYLEQTGVALELTIKDSWSHWLSRYGEKSFDNQKEVGRSIMHGELSPGRLKMELDLNKAGTVLTGDIKESVMNFYKSQTMNMGRSK